MDKWVQDENILGKNDRKYTKFLYYYVFGEKDIVFLLPLAFFKVLAQKEWWSPTYFGFTNVWFYLKKWKEANF